MFSKHILNKLNFIKNIVTYIYIYMNSFLIVCNLKNTCISSITTKRKKKKYNLEHLFSTIAILHKKVGSSWACQ